VRITNWLSRADFDPSRYERGAPDSNERRPPCRDQIEPATTKGSKRDIDALHTYGYSDEQILETVR